MILQEESEKLLLNTLYYDTRCSFCTFLVKLLAKIYPIKIHSSWDNTHTKELMLKKHTWVYVDKDVKEWHQAEALLHIFKKRKATSFLYTLLNKKPIQGCLNHLYTSIAKNRLCKNGDVKKSSLGLLKKISLVVVVLFLVVSFFYRQTILFHIGNFFFKGSMYNISIAKTLFIAADRSDDQKIIWLNYQLSRIYFIEGDLNSAITYANKELRYHPENCRTYYIRGLAFGYLDRTDAAIQDFKKFNKCFLATWAGHNDLAWFYFQKGNLQDALATIEEVIRIYPTNPWIYNTYGTILMNAGRTEEALTALKNAKRAAENISDNHWGGAYPGNDPRIYEMGLGKMRATIDENIKIAENLKTIPSKK